MLKSWTLQQFKSVNDKTKLQIAPLTLFTGANNAGKSTIIQSMLLTTQTIQNPIEDRSVVLNGHITRLGTFEDIASNSSDTTDISIGFELQPLEQTDKKARRVFLGNRPRKNFKNITVECNYTFTYNKNTEMTNLYPHLKSCNVKVGNEKKVEEMSIEKGDISESIKDFKISPRYLDSFEDALQYKVTKIPEYLNERKYYRNHPNNGRPAGASMNHFLPNRITLVYDLVEEEISKLVDMASSPTSYYYRGTDYEEYITEKFHELIVECLDHIYKENNVNYNEKRSLTFQKALIRFSETFSLDKLKRCFDILLADDQRKYTAYMLERTSKLKELARSNKPVENALFNGDLPDFASYASESITNYFTNNVKYLGPLRDEPKPIYPHAGATDSRDVGYKGEHTAAVLELHKNTKIDYISPSDLNIESNTHIVKNDFLISAVLDWLRYMGVVSNVETTDKGKLGHELKVSVNEDMKWHDLTHVGVGVSQVLPILVLSLLASKGSTLIFEQPELHLHPKVQTRLADFFVSMTNIGKQCIVETHSEYLINRLRYRTVVSQDSNFTNNIILYFVEKERGNSKYKAIRINKFGVIEEWPKGFFDESEEMSASILKAAMAKRKKELHNRE
ncbi:DUF3696 domain-containing protein [Paenibacillus sp. L3-i20]|uniref:AAA family ATPase n=1 Tax=Paenibacillus sp. L3-i20 TaxID=2905833 RepID=UPI001EDD14DD|nr:DUF3696 domain-containing protein [Paenibacillus sp. L3-i20]GKU79427.1 hypothetical protein L3i20_v238240 [Paenibacillus sp. L3-i20]